MSGSIPRETVVTAPSAPAPRRPADADADVIVVGGGPGGAAAAHYLAQAGVDVLLLEKTTYPRDKVCGDGLTPRSVRALVTHGHRHLPGSRVAAEQGPAGHRRRAAARAALARAGELPRLRADPHPRRARRAAGPPGPEERRPPAGGDHRPGWSATTTAGSSASPPRSARTRRPPPTARRWSSPPTACPAGSRSPSGIAKRDDRPMGVAVRALLPTARGTTTTTWSPGWSCRTAGSDGRSALLPGYGWIFGLGDGTSNVGLGILNTLRRVRQYRLPRTCCPAGCDGPARGVGLRRGERDRAGARRRAADGLQPHAALRDGLLLVGDAGGVVNPFNGEGIAYAMESGEMAADIIVQALARPTAGRPGAGAAGLPRRR